MKTWNKSCYNICRFLAIKGGIKNDIDLNKLKLRLREIRKLNKLTQEKVALVLSDSQSTYWNYECGNSIIPISKLYLLSKFYNVSIDYFVGKTDDVQIKKQNVFVP